jgi:uncharacterized membrane-anchored protein YhcB (DUF1043 family)
MEVITLIIGIVVGAALGFLIATLALKKATPQELWDRLVWALDRAENNPALRPKMDAAAEFIQKKLQDWLVANWKN